MYQQINMYQPVFRRQRKVLSAATLLQVFAVAAVVLLGFYGHARWTLGSLETTATSLTSQYRQLEVRLGTLENDETDAAVTMLDEIDRLQQTIEDRQLLLDRFSQLSVRESDGFSQFFETLARQSTPGLWLTGIRLKQDGETELRGSTLNPELVPRYLQDMPEQPRFAALLQGSVHLARHKPGKPDIAFVLSTNTVEEL